MFNRSSKLPLNINVMIDDDLPIKLTGEDGYLLVIDDSSNLPKYKDHLLKTML